MGCNGDNVGKELSIGARTVAGRRLSFSTGTATGIGAIIDFSSSTPLPGNVAENAFVIVSDDGVGGASNGRIYRIGATTGAANVYNFFPGQGPGPNDPALTNATVFVIGRAPDPNNPGNVGGTVQDVSVYTTYVQTP